VKSLRKEKIWEGFMQIKNTWPDAQLSNTFHFISIPSVKLPSQFNCETTPLLIRLNPDSDYIAPEAYVTRSLTVNGSRSHHLDENFTEDVMLEGGWVKLCAKMNWSPNFSLVDYVIMVIDYLENLRE
jgi:hypothetical protein